MKIVLYQPDIPQNTGGFIRLCACLGMELHIIEPCGFIWDERRLSGVALDYLPLACIIKHQSFSAFLDFKQAIPSARLVLLTTKSAVSYTDASYQPGDFLILGRESSGVPQEVHDAADLRVTIPMQPGARSLNVLTAASMVAGEMIRQIG